MDGFQAAIAVSVIVAVLGTAAALVGRRDSAADLAAAEV